MIGFFIKKSFFDGWDNLLSLVVLNLGYVALFGSAYVVIPALDVSILLALGAASLWLFVFQIYSGTVSFFTYEIARYRRGEFLEFIAYMKKAFRYVPLMTGLSAALMLLYLVVLPFYLSVPGVFSAVAAAVVFWIGLFALIALQYYYPLAVQLGNSPFKVLKKCMLLCLDNFGFSMYLFFHTLITAAVSVFTVLLVPGFAGILLGHQVGAKLRLFKYDYLEENPESNRKDIPWDALLSEEREKVGPRTIRGMIFPWKE